MTGRSVLEPASAARGAHGARSVPILMYHQVAPVQPPSYARYTVSVKAFSAQMRWLALARYTALTMDGLLEAWRRRSRLPARAVVITFDDGFRDCVRLAVPVLQRHGLRATFYLVAGLVGGTSRWTLATSGTAFPLLDWAEARALLEAGMECGAHSLTHPPLAELGPPDQQEELVESRRVLEDQLGREIRHLAYPFGSVNRNVREAAERAGYVSACTTDKGLARAGDDPLMLRRVPIYGSDSLVDFVFRLRTAETARQTLRRRAPRGALALYRKLRGGAP
jgi:peptidoglycan/xylan/chitin deacetylase (PgdA/CDA1 family)